MTADYSQSFDERIGDVSRRSGADEAHEGLMFLGSIHSWSAFVIVSPVLEWTPNVEAVQDVLRADYNTRMIRYLNTSERAVLFQAEEAQVPDYDREAGYVVDGEGDTIEGTDVPKPEVFGLSQESAPYGDADDLLVVEYAPVSEPAEEHLIDGERWWLDPENGDDDGGAGDASR